jgi:hypothetical protein
VSRKQDFEVAWPPVRARVALRALNTGVVGLESKTSAHGATVLCALMNVLTTREELNHTSPWFSTFTTE